MGDLNIDVDKRDSPGYAQLNDFVIALTVQIRSTKKLVPLKLTQQGLT